MIDYIIYFIVFSIIGWTWENLIGKPQTICGDTMMHKIKLCLPFLVIYGIGGNILLFIKKNIVKNNIIKFSIFSGILLTIMECIIGQISFKINKYKTWNYDKDPFHFCDGYVSLPVMIFWIIASSIFYVVHESNILKY